jgi:hypothetical protein
MKKRRLDSAAAVAIETQALRIALELSRQREQWAFQMLQEMRAALDNACRVMASRNLPLPKSHVSKSTGSGTNNVRTDSKTFSANTEDTFDLELDAADELSSTADSDAYTSQSASEFELFL